MRRFLAVLFVFFLAVPARAQGPVVYFPLVFKDTSDMATCDNHWKIVVPEATTNMVLNPSFELATNYAAAGAAVLTRSGGDGKYGLYGMNITSNGDGQGISMTLSTLSNAVYYVTVRAKGTLPSTWRWALGPSFRTPLLLEEIDDDWDLWGAAFPASEANGSTTLYLVQGGGGSADFYLDGVQVEAHEYWTTYCDGTRDGCGWNGAEHASSSTRSALSRAGGRVRDLADDYSFYVTEHSGTGMGPQRLSVDDYALLPGGELNAVKSQSRVWTLTGDFLADSEEDLHAKRQALLSVLDPGAYDAQPMLVRYTGADVEKEIAAVYEAGLEISGMPSYYGPYRRDATGAEWQEDFVFSERAAVRFLSPDPRWYEIGESAVSLDPYDTATFRLVAGRLRATGQWDNLGPPGAPGTATYNAVRAFAEDDTYLYVAGDFLNFDNNANCDYICRYDKQTGTWSALGSGTNGIVYALAIAPDGHLFVGGAFGTAGGGAALRIAEWDPDAGTWSALGSGTDSTVYALAFGLDGTLYVGGQFTTAGGIAVGRIASWDGSWHDLVSNFNATVYALAIGLDGTLYAGGSFTTAGGAPGDRIASYDGSTWSAMGDGIGTPGVLALSIYEDGTLYIGGDFTTPGNRVVRWNGTAYETLGDGTNQTVYSLAVGPDGFVYIGGLFTSAGGITVADRVAKWNGSSFGHLDIDLPGSPSVYAIRVGVPDPVINGNYDIYLGFSTTGTGSLAGTVDAENGGTADAYPEVVFERAGGDDATIEELRNESLGLELLFNYGLLDGERLTIDLTPTQKSIISNYFGRRPDAILANSDFGEWHLQPGTNQTTAFVNYTQSLYPAEITAYLLWRDGYLSVD